LTFSVTLRGVATILSIANSNAATKEVDEKATILQQGVRARGSPHKRATSRISRNTGGDIQRIAHASLHSKLLEASISRHDSSDCSYGALKKKSLQNSKVVSLGTNAQVIKF